MSALCPRIEDFAAICMEARDYYLIGSVNRASKTAQLHFGRYRNQIAVAGEGDAEFGDAALDGGAQQSRELLPVTIARHCCGQRGGAHRCRVEINFAEPVGQVRDEAEQAIFVDAAAPSEAENMVVDEQARTPQPAPQPLDPRPVERRDITLFGECGAQRRD